MKEIKSLKIGDKFKTNNLSATFVVMSINSDKVGYRHLITDYPNKVHYYVIPGFRIIPINS